MNSPTPQFDDKAAIAVTPYRHTATGRTVSFHQVDKDSAHLFSATAVFVATEKAADAAANAANESKKAAMLAADSAAAIKAEHDERVKVSKMTPAERDDYLKAKAAQAAK